MIPKLLKQLDWRIFLAMSITFFWIGSGTYHLGVNIGWDNFINQPLESLGGFLEGAFAPLAFLWLVIGFFLQQKELSKNTDVIQKQHTEMQKSAKHAALQANSIQASVLHSQQQSFIQIYEMVRISLGSVIGMLYMSSQGPAGNGAIDSDEMTNLWAKMSNGDAEIFSRRFLVLNASEQENMGELLYGTDIRASHSDNFVRQHTRLIEAAKDCDPDDMLVDAIRDSPHGRLYELMLKHGPGAKS